MYLGIEIQHPLYAVLFVNLIVPLISSATNLVCFSSISVDKYIQVRIVLFIDRCFNMYLVRQVLIPWIKRYMQRNAHA
jgi:hypothetical protein